jgi:nucleoside-diphosphate-sugar epimerase
VNILISGATGYIGSNLLAYFDNPLNNISIVDRSYSIINSQNEYDIFLYLSNPNEIDFSNDSEGSVRSMTEHCSSIQVMLENLSINFIIYASTVRVYDGRKNIYAKTHLFIESQIKKYTSENGILLSIVRFGNIFGGTINSMVKRHTLVPHVFIKSAIEKGEIILKTNGKQSRDFVPMLFVLQYFEYVIRERPLYIDICSGNNFTILEVALIVSNTFSNIKIKINNIKIKDTVANCTSILKINKKDIEREVLSISREWSRYYESNDR